MSKEPKAKKEKPIKPNRPSGKKISFLANKTKKEKIGIIVTASIIFVFILLSALVEVLFAGTAFESIISNSIGKFFNLFKFFSDNYVKMLESLTIVVFVWILHKVLKLIILLMMRKGQRSETIGNLFSSMMKYLSVILAVFLILSAWGVETPTLLAGAGIIGLALSFGAQSLIEDVISGLFIIFERQFAVGDVVQIGDFRGTVLEIGIRDTRLEDINGDIKIVNNGDIRGAINTSYHLSPAICDVSISYGEDILRVEEIIKANLEQMKVNIPDIQEGPYYRGVQSLSDSSVVIRIYAKAYETKKYQVVRDMNREMKLMFDRNNIQIPFPQIVVHYEENGKEEKAG